MAFTLLVGRSAGGFGGLVLFISGCFRKMIVTQQDQALWTILLEGRGQSGQGDPQPERDGKIHRTVKRIWGICKMR